jgi:hypothetical protein
MNGPALGAIAVGSVFLYSAVKGKSVLASAQAIIQGKSPQSVAQSTNITDNTAADTAAGTNSLGVQNSGLPSAGTYNHAQLVSLWTQAGGSPATANNAACHGMQESSGNPQATSSNPDGGENVGIWQLDTKGVGAGHSVSSLMNALNNARITVFATHNGTNWSQWATPGC